MPNSAKYFAERLNNCLDEMGVPSQTRDRSLVLSKMLNISKHEAWNLLEGHQIPKPDLLQNIAMEFEVDPKWLYEET